MNKEPAVNGRFNIIRTSRSRGQIFIFFDKLSETSQKRRLELQKVENWTTVAKTI